MAARLGSVSEAACPAESDPDHYSFLPGASLEWLALVAEDGSALRITPSGVGLGLQDDRKWDKPWFRLMATVGRGRLTASEPLRFGLTLAAETAEEVAMDARAITASSLAGLDMTDHRPLRLGRVTLDKAEVEVYSHVEIRADVEATYENPFDPDDIRVDAEVTGPDGQVWTVPGFYYVPLRLEVHGESENLLRDGSPDFRVRFTPLEPGEHRLVLVVRDGEKAVRSEPMRVTARPGTSPGFVRVAPESPRYFAFDNGQPYFAVGENACWSWNDQALANYRAWLAGLGAAGGNWARLWLSFNEKGQEWMPQPTPKGGMGSYLGLGRYAQDNAWRLDEIVRMGEESDVYLMLCLGTFGEFTEGGYFNEGSWVSNPYNAANGGPCATPADFWTDPQARRLYQQRLRYLIARWGYSDHVFAWEFWNEVPPTPDQVAWVAEMATYFKQHDPTRRLVSTTYGDTDTWDCPDVDFTMSHMYGSAGNVADFTPMILSEVAKHRANEKPYLLAEFGIDWQTYDGKWDPKGTGLNMHNGAWAAALSGAAGTAMLWYWDGYVHPNDLYHILTPVRRFADTIDWAHTAFQPLAEVGLELPPGTPETFSDLHIPSTVEWGATPSSEYTVGRDGSVQGGPVARTIGSPFRADPKELNQEQTWRLDMPAAGTVVVRLGMVSNSARLQIRLDGELRVDRELLTGEMGQGPWKEAKWLEQYGIWNCRYDEDIPIEVPAGEHTLSITNAEGDWLQVPEIRLPGYRSSRFPDVNTLGLSSDRLVLLWLHNRQSTWRAEFEGQAPTLLPSLRVTVPVPADGAWNVEWWNTFNGEVTQRETLTAAGGKLLLRAPDLMRDVAVRMEREG